MTPSPSPTTPSSHSSRPTSSPPDSAVQGTPRPTLAPLARSPSSPVFFQPGPSPPSLSTRTSGSSSAPAFSGVSSEPSRYGKQTSEESESSSSETVLQARSSIPEAPDQDPEPSTSSAGDPEPQRHPGKKKRTRTLTTPQQSAVLHALLAQSRFPTTAMREEVGRSIGLSARKVQVWFQNQRQKARRPHQQSATPVERPPQYEAFTSGISTVVGSEPGPSGVSGPSQGMEHIGPQPPYVSESSSTSALLGGLPAPHAGMSLYSPYHPPEFREYPPARTPPQEQPPHSGVPYGYASRPARSGDGHLSPPPPLFTTPSSHYPYHPPPANPLHVYSLPPLPGPPMMRSDSPIVLPPLRFDQPRTSHFQGGLPRPPLPGLDLRVSPYPTSIPSLSPSELSSSSSSPFGIPQLPSRHREIIPPPFTLQPEPQWDPPHPGPRPMPTLHPPVGPSQSSSHMYPRQRTSSDPTRTLPTPSSHNLQQPLPTLQPWPLSTLGSESMTGPSVGMSMHRFDPVHSVVSERERDGTYTTEDHRGSMARRNRHTYDFGRPSGSMSMGSPPQHSDGGEQAGDQESVAYREGP